MSIDTKASKVNNVEMLLKTVTNFVDQMRLGSKHRGKYVNLIVHGKTCPIGVKRVVMYTPYMEKDVRGYKGNFVQYIFKACLSMKI